MGRIQFEMLGDLTLARTSFEKANSLEANDLESLDAESDCVSRGST